MHVALLTPLGALFGLTALVPLGVALTRHRRLTTVRRALSLPRPPAAAIVVPVVALALVPVLLGVAATQPVIETTRTLPQRTDAQAFFVMDISRSMLASAGAGAPIRLARARRLAERVAGDVPELPIGLAGMTDRVLPYLFPTTDRRVLAATLEETVGIEQPPPGSFYLTQATSLGSLAAVPQLNYFPRSARKRVLVVFTDGESNPVGAALAEAYRQRPPIATVFVRIGDQRERIYNGSVQESGYEPRRDSAATLARAASLTGGRVFGEGEPDAVARAVRGAIGSGPTVAKRHEGGRLPLMPWIAALAFLPLSVVLARRNFILSMVVPEGVGRRRRQIAWLRLALHRESPP